MDDIDCICIPCFFGTKYNKNQNMVYLFISGYWINLQKCQTAKLIMFYQVWGSGERGGVEGILGRGWGYCQYTPISNIFQPKYRKLL